MVLFILEYLKNTEMKRAHLRGTMKRNLNAYYKAIENLINLSKYRSTVIDILPKILSNDKYEIFINEQGQYAVNMDKLQALNTE